MYQVLVLTKREGGLVEAPWSLDSQDVSYSVASELEADGLTSLDITPDVVLVDVDSVSNGLVPELVSLCHRLRLPVVTVLSSRQLADQADATELNADDFIVYPFARAELLARLKQAIFRLHGPRSQRIIKVGDLVIDQDRYEVSVAGRRVRLTYKEYQLLMLLASNPGRVYTRDSLLSLVWEYDYFGGTRTVDVHIRRLRANIEDTTHSFIETVWNVGYRFKGS